MTQDKLFEDGSDQPQYDLTKPLKDQLVGEGRKFKDDESLAAAKIESDKYIKTLERQLDVERADREAIETEYKGAASLRELLDQYKEAQQHDGNNQNANPVIEQPSFDQNKLETIIEQKLIQKDTERKEQSNFNEFRSKLKERFGNNEQAFQAHVEDLGLSIEDVKSLAKKSPKAAFKTLGLEEQPSRDDLFQAPPRNQTRSDNFAPKSELRDWAFYEKMRKEQPERYRDPRTHVQMHKDATEIDEKHGPGAFMRRK